MFENDVFISYSHIDNQPLGPDQEGWITILDRSLRVRLGQLLGREPRIWRDPKLQGNDHFSDELVDKFANVAALVCVLSPRYVKSEWCMREFQGFLEARRRAGGVDVGGKSRVFKVTKTQIPLESHPDAVRGLLGYDFFSVDPDTGRAREHNLYSGPERERRYWAQLDDLAMDLSQLLATDEAFGAASAPAGTEAVRLEGGGEGAGKKVFIAEASFDLKEERDTLKRDLSQRGYTIEPHEALPLIASEIERVVPQILAECELAIHLSGRNYGLVPEGATESMAELQNKLSVELAERQGLRRLIWIPRGVEAEDDRQRTLLDALRTDPAVQGGADVFETPIEEFKAAVLKKLEPEPPAPTNGSSEAAGEGEPSLVYLICDRQDVEDTQPIGDLLYDRGLEVALPVFEGDAAEVRLDHEENLKLCEGVLIYYGKAKEIWLRSKLRELKKIAGYGRAEPMRAKGVYVAEPSSPEKERFRTREAIVIKSLESPSPELLQPFLDALEG
jgi:hypothetical protein